MINFKTIIRIIGILLLLETVMFLVCSGVSFYYRESDMLDFWKAGGITADRQAERLCRHRYSKSIWR